MATSTNDSFVLIATGQAGTRRSPVESPEGRAAARGGVRGCPPLAQAIVRDGRGATKFITVRVDGGDRKTSAPCRVCDRPSRW